MPANCKTTIPKHITCPAFEKPTAHSPVVADSISAPRQTSAKRSGGGRNRSILRTDHRSGRPCLARTGTHLQIAATYPYFTNPNQPQSQNTLYAPHSQTHLAFARSGRFHIGPAPNVRQTKRRGSKNVRYPVPTIVVAGPVSPEPEPTYKSPLHIHTLPTLTNPNPKTHYLPHIRKTHRTRGIPFCMPCPVWPSA